MSPSLVTPYDQLPMAPAGPGDDAHAERSLETLAPDAQDDFRDLETHFAVALSAAGWGFERIETRRTGERQVWLWKIGREWQAPGRDGIVTDVKTPHGPHGRGDAADYRYFPIADNATQESLTAALRSVAVAYDGVLLWLGDRALSDGSHDPAHWEKVR